MTSDCESREHSTYVRGTVSRKLYLLHPSIPPQSECLETCGHIQDQQPLEFIRIVFPSLRVTKYPLPTLFHRNGKLPTHVCDYLSLLFFNLRFLAETRCDNEFPVHSTPLLTRSRRCRKFIRCIDYLPESLSAGGHGSQSPSCPCSACLAQPFVRFLFETRPGTPTEL